ncbi:MAG TPA: hypothetical protein VKE42_12225 [Candidatus Cybelea sp.]|nr:hypothetical protein [Candidatus Cybelea sp.]
MSGNNLAIQTTTRFVTIDCYKCGIVFAVASELHSNWQRDKTQFFCPNGHGQSYCESEADRLRKQLADVQRDRDWQRQRADSLNKQLTTAKQTHKRLRRRVNAGVCPHCNRTVRQMAAHIQTKHPEKVEPV